MKTISFVLRIPNKLNKELEKECKEKQWSKNTYILEILRNRT